MNQNVGDIGNAAMQLKRTAEELDEGRSLKLPRTDANVTVNMMPHAAMVNTQAMFNTPQQLSNHFFVGSQPLMPQSLHFPAQNVSNYPPHHHLQMNVHQQQQQYPAAMAARHHTQQQHQQQTTVMATMMGKQDSSDQLNHMKPMASAEQQQLPTSGENVHLDSLMDMNFYMNASSGDLIPPQPLSGTVSSVTPHMPATSVAPITLQKSEEPCLLCGMKGDVVTCNGGCELHVHLACIGEDAIFPFVGMDRLCGSCFIAQQNRASSEDLTKGGPNALSVRRAILCINFETNDNANFDKFGHLASLRLAEIGSIAGYPIKPFAEKFVEPFLQRWIREKLTSTDKWMLSVREVFTVMIGLYSLKRACIAHGLHQRVIDLMKARNFTVTDYFGWHPAVDCPTVRCSSLCAVCGIRNAPNIETCSRCHHKLVFPTTFTKYISTLLAAFYAEQVRIPLGASTLDVFAHTNTVRGLYKGLRPFDADGVSWDLFTDQLRMVFGLLDIMSNFGTLQLNPDLFTPEANIIFNAAYVNQAMITNEFEVVGKFLQCMKLFGHAKIMENKNMIESCERYLLFKHLPNGSWCKTNGSKVDQYKATVTCSKALLTPTFCGHGPISLDFQRLLEKWARNSSPKSSSTAMVGGKQLAETAKPKRLASGVTVKAHTHARLQRLEAMYQRQIAPNGRDTSLESLMIERMKQLLKAKKLETTTKVKTSAEEKKSGKTGKKPIHENDGIDENGSHNEAVLVEVKASIAADGTTDSEDVRSEHQSDRNSRASAEKDQDEDEDMLTNMSLHEDLEIFDGLQFEDGGGIIDMSFHSLRHNEEANDDSVEHTIEDTDGTDAPGQEDDEDETMDDHVYDDDEDENEDNASYLVDGEACPRQSPFNEGVDTANDRDVITDVPSGM